MLNVDKEKLSWVIVNAVKKWGVEAQKGMAMEEMGELLTALNQYDRRRIDKEEVIEEIADVFLMIHQLAVMFGIEETEKVISEKLDKVYRKLNR